MKTISKFLIAGLCASLTALPVFGAEPGGVKDPAPVIITPRVAAELGRLWIKLEDKDLLRLAETRNYWRQRGAAVWPGADISTITAGFMFAGKGTIVLNHPAPPGDCLPLAADIPAAQWCRGAAPNLPVPTGKLYGGFPAVFLVTKEECEKNKIEACAGSYADYSGTALHETFHAWQWAEYQAAGLSRRSALVSPAWSAGREKALFLALELKLLNDALAAGDGAAFTELLLDYLITHTTQLCLNCVPKCELQLDCLITHPNQLCLNCVPKCELLLDSLITNTN